MLKITRLARSDGTETRARILKSAGELFAMAGFAEAPSKEIALRANVDVASINYHFGSRDGLYRAVLVEAHKRLISLEELVEISRSEQTPEERLSQLIDVMEARLSGDATWFTRILSRELLAPTTVGKSLFAEDLRAKTLIVGQLLSEFTGIPASDPVFSACMIGFSAPNAMLMSIGIGSIQIDGIESGERLAGFLPLLRSFVLAGLKQLGVEYARTHCNTNAGHP